MVLDRLNSADVQSALRSGSILRIEELFPKSVLMTSTDPLVASMMDSYRKGVSDNIDEGYGTAVSEEFATAATSEHLSVVDNYVSTTQQQILNSLAEASALKDDSGDVDIVLKTYLAAVAIKAIFNKLRTTKRKPIIDAAVLGPYNQGLFDSAQAMVSRTGVEVKKQWVSLMDERVRASHAQLNGDVVSVGSPFYVNGVPIRFPKDPLAPPGLTIGCRCVLRFTT